ncbi:MAG: 50S ribosomal protein L18Ae [Thermoplasmata archaeon]
MKAFRIEGEFLMKDKWQSFVKEIASKDKKAATESLLSDMGGRHRAKRKNIKIHDIKELKLEEVENPLVREELAGDEGGE